MQKRRGKPAAHVTRGTTVSQLLSHESASATALTVGASYLHLVHCTIIDYSIYTYFSCTNREYSSYTFMHRFLLCTYEVFDNEVSVFFKLPSDKFGSFGGTVCKFECVKKYVCHASKPLQEGIGYV